MDSFWIEVPTQQRPELHMNVSTTQGPELHLDVSKLQRALQHLDVSTPQGPLCCSTREACAAL